MKVKLFMENMWEFFLVFLFVPYKVHIIPAAGMRALYFALIHSHLVYCSSLLSMLSAKNVNKIKKIQKKALRIMDSSS